MRSNFGLRKILAYAAIDEHAHIYIYIYIYICIYTHKTKTKIHKTVIRCKATVTPEMKLKEEQLQN